MLTLISHKTIIIYRIFYKRWYYDLN